MLSPLKSQQANVVAIKPGTQLRKPVAVVVDDDEAATLYLTEYLLEKGWKVHAFVSAAEAMEFFRSRIQEDPLRFSNLPCEVVFTDLRMPELDGMSILKEIHKHYPTLPVVVMTAYASIPAAVDAIHDGALDYLPKPLSLARIGMLLRKLTLEES